MYNMKLYPMLDYSVVIIVLTNSNMTYTTYYLVKLVNFRDGNPWHANKMLRVREKIKYLLNNKI